MQTILAYIQLARFPLSLLLPGFAVTASYVISSNARFEWPMLIPILAALLGTAGMCALNDFYDVEADQLGARKRPLPSGRISMRNGLSFAILLTVFGLGLTALSATRELTLTGSAAVLLGLLYNSWSKGKGILGTLNFGLIMVAVTLLGMVANGLKTEHSLFLLFVFFVASTNQATANFYDYASDRTVGYRIIPNQYGLQKGAILVSLLRFTGMSFLAGYLYLLAPDNLLVLSLAALLLAQPIISYQLLRRAVEIRYARIAFVVAVASTLLSFATILFAVLA